MVPVVVFFVVIVIVINAKSAKKNIKKR